MVGHELSCLKNCWRGRAESANMSTVSSGLYATLGIAQDATDDEIKKAYRKLAMQVLTHLLLALQTRQAAVVSCSGPAVVSCRERVVARSESTAGSTRGARLQRVRALWMSVH